MISMKSAFRKEVLRAVTGSFGRFLAIAAIVALGCGFYAGLRMTGPDMRYAGDQYLAGTHFYDLDVASTAGISDSMLDDIRDISGVEGVQATKSSDVMAQIGENQLAARVESMDFSEAENSEQDGVFSVSSDNNDYLNRPMLASGRWPTSDDECVISADRIMSTPVNLGDEVTLLYGDDNFDNTFQTKTLRVVGTIHSPEFMSSIGMGTTSLGDGTIEQIILVNPSVFSDSYPNTQAYVKVAGAQNSYSDSDAYDATIQPVQDALESKTDAWTDDLRQQFEDQVREQAQSQMEEQQQQALQQLTAQGLPLEQAQAALQTQMQTQQADVQAQIDAQVDSFNPDIYVLDRSHNYGVSSFKSDSERVDHIASIFPLVFFLVAALVSLTSMTRMVDSERPLIGTLKALGYTKRAITMKYVFYAALASCIGAAVGILTLTQFFPWTICRAYAIIYSVPQTPIPLPVDAGLAWLSAGLGIGITLLATWAAVRSTLRESPATLIVPKAPAPGKQIWLERFHKLWARMSFSWKVTWRNVFRYKRRMAMTVVGIAGCTALLLTGFGLHDAIWDIIDRQFGDILTYNVVVQTHDNLDDAALLGVRDQIQDTGDGTDIVAAYQRNMQASSPDHDAVSVVTYVPTENSDMSQAFSLRNHQTRQQISVDDNSVVLTEKAARSLGVSPGDTITIYDLNAIGDPVGDGMQLTVTDVAEYYVNNAVFVGEDAWRDATGDYAHTNTFFSKVTNDQEQRDTLTDDLHANTDVSTVSYIDETVDTYRTMLSSVNTIVVVLVVSAALLAFIVLYDITKINVEERRREIASLKVLGFVPREVDAYIFREIGILVLIGTILGLFLGIWLEGFVVTSAEVDYVMFSREIHALSYVWAILVTIGFAALVMFSMRGELKKVDMVESLKSVD